MLRGKKEAIDFVRNLLKEEIPAISALAFYEIWAGARAHEEDVITEFLSEFVILPVDQDVTKQSARYYAAFRKKGITLSVTDALN